MFLRVFSSCFCVSFSVIQGMCSRVVRLCYGGTTLTNKCGRSGAYPIKLQPLTKKSNLRGKSDKLTQNRTGYFLSS